MREKTVGKHLVFGAACLMLAASHAFAVGKSVDQTDHVPYLSGSVDSAEMRSLRFHYNVNLTFVDKTGAYLSGVRVQIVTEKGDLVIDAVSKGPLFYARPRLSLEKLGRYQLIVSKDGKSRQYDIEIGPTKSAELRIAL
ncbi:hypothetical protein AAHK20_21060 [Trinickia sp. YCB016]